MFLSVLNLVRNIVKSVFFESFNNITNLSCFTNLSCLTGGTGKRATATDGKEAERRGAPTKPRGTAGETATEGSPQKTER